MAQDRLPERERGGRAVVPGLVVLSLLLFLWHARQLDFLIDDVFISLRYAANLLSGQGLVFNPGERVEGYTNFLWVLAGAAALALGIEPLAFCRWAALLAGAAMIAALPRLSLGLSAKPRWMAAVPALLLAACTPFALWSQAGLETSLFALLATLGVLLAQAEGAGLVAASAALTLACLTRPEGHLFALLAAGGVALRRRRAGRPLVDGPALAAAGLAAAVLLPYHLWRLAWFGSLLPNTFPAKVTSGEAQLLRGASYLGGFLAQGLTALAPALAAWTVLARRREPRILLPGLCVGAYILYVFLVGGDSMHGYRFLVPVLPLTALLFVEALHPLAERLSRGGAAPALAPAALVALPAAVGLSWFWAGSDGFMEEARRQTHAVRRWVEVGRWLGAHVPAGTRLALGAVGAIPYYSGLPTTDLFGLTDPVIARTKTAGMGSGLAGHERSNVARVLERRPDLILSYAVLTDRPLSREEAAPLFRGSQAERELWASPLLWERYRLASLRIGEGYLNVLARADGAVPAPAAPGPPPR